MNSGTENCEEDSAKLLLTIKDVTKIDVTDYVAPTQTKAGIIQDTDYKNNILLKKFNRYISGYLINKCLQQHTCKMCEDYANAYQNLDDSSIFCYFKAYKTKSLNIFGNLKMPDDDFVNLIAAFEHLYELNFKNIILKDNVINEFVKIFQRIEFRHPCPLFPYQYLLHLYTRVKMFYSLKYANRNFISCGKNRKLIIWRHQ